MHGHDSMVDPCLLGSFWQNFGKAAILDDKTTPSSLTLLAAFSQVTLMLGTSGQ